jgi:hypothetical protein
MNDQHVWPKVGDLVTLSMPHGWVKLVVRSVVKDAYGVPYARCSDPTDTTTYVRRVDLFHRGWPS